MKAKIEHNSSVYLSNGAQVPYGVEYIHPKLGVCMEFYKTRKEAQQRKRELEGKPMMTQQEIRIHREALRICGFAWEDAPDCDSFTKRLEWVRANNMVMGNGAEIDAEALDALIVKVKALGV